MTGAIADHLADIARSVGYHDGAGWPDDHGDDDCPVDNLIAYKDSLEDEVGRLMVKASAWDVMDAALTSNAAGDSHASAADVCAAGFAQQEAIAASVRAV